MFALYVVVVSRSIKMNWETVSDNHLDVSLFIRLFFNRENERERARARKKRSWTDNFNKKRFLLLVQIDTSDWLTVALCLYMQLLKMKWREENMFSLSVAFSISNAKESTSCFFVYVFNQLIIVEENKILLKDFK